ncbi:hypothetical protein K1W54_28895 [Micromonospora sp. CPCC 205371]|nr:hypothetical protein [Micromonospora sp. CPCC 205371]
MRRVSREVAGAWRSLQYDMARRPESASVDVTTDVLYPEYEATERPRRKLLAATTFGALSLAGAAGTYFAVVTGLGALSADEPAGQPHALPAVAPSSPGAPQRQPAATPATMPPTAQVGRRTTPPPPKPPPRRTRPGPAGGRPPAPSPTCACVTPPVPRPTSPPPVVNSPEPSPSPTTPQETESPNPDPTPTPAP